MNEREIARLIAKISKSLNGANAQDAISALMVVATRVVAGYMPPEHRREFMEIYLSGIEEQEPHPSLQLSQRQ